MDKISVKIQTSKISETSGRNQWKSKLEFKGLQVHDLVLVSV